MKNIHLHTDPEGAVRQLVSELAICRRELLTLKDQESQMRTIMITIAAMLFSQEEIKAYGGTVPFVRVIERAGQLALLIPRQPVMETLAASATKEDEET